MLDGYTLNYEHDKRRHEDIRFQKFHMQSLKAVGGFRKRTIASAMSLCKWMRQTDQNIDWLVNRITEEQPLFAHLNVTSMNGYKYLEKYFRQTVCEVAEYISSNTSMIINV